MFYWKKGPPARADASAAVFRFTFASQAQQNPAACAGIKNRQLAVIIKLR